MVPRFSEFVPALAYHICLALPAVFTQPGAHLEAKPCKLDRNLEYFHSRLHLKTFEKQALTASESFLPHSKALQGLMIPSERTLRLAQFSFQRPSPSAKEGAPSGLAQGH